MQVRQLAVPGSFEFTPQHHRDHRGVFVSPMEEPAFVEAVGHGFHVAQTNQSRSAKGVLRGVHFTTTPPGQAKYVHCVNGRALDVVVDLRVGSPTFGVWDTVELDTVSFRSVYLPVGVGHAFLALEDDTAISYLVSTGYRAGLEQAVDAFDPKLGLPWPKDTEFIVSERDTAALSLDEALEKGVLARYADCLPGPSAAAS
ncbi:dTDP-4-dehydrorhamnose 3,5-epimerase [Streptomyces sp. NPDC002809]|uniref:dTDP-4-dehydrorhamnose 3,5-epimerase family protein n=1 Tax=Streptomyces sp. NPDC002809 TaxID=3154433 RepID=UPI00331CE470